MYNKGEGVFRRSTSSLVLWGKGKKKELQFAYVNNYYYLCTKFLESHEFIDPWQSKKRKVK